MNHIQAKSCDAYSPAVVGKPDSWRRFPGSSEGLQHEIVKLKNEWAYFIRFSVANLNTKMGGFTVYSSLHQNRRKER